jgi:hypothetical protein
VEAIVGIDGMQPAPDVVDPEAEARERIRLQIDIAKIDRAGSGGANQPMLLPVDAGVTHRTFGVVPNREFLGHRIGIFETCRE